MRKCLRASAVRKTLQSLPTTLDETYDRILLAIEDEYRQEAISALIWLVFSERPLRIEEVAEAMVIDIHGDPPFDAEERLFEPESVLAVLSSLISVTNREGLRDEEGKITLVTEIQLAHFSVKEYLASDRLSRGPASSFKISEVSANQHIFQSCLHYLICINVHEQDTFFPLNKSHPLLEYASTYCFRHGRKCQETATEAQSELTIKFLQSTEAFRIWRRTFLVNPPWLHSEQRLPRVFEAAIPDRPLFYAAYLGLDSVVETLLDNGVAADHPTDSDCSPLQVAALKGYDKIVRKLLEKGANIDAQGTECGTALHAACFGNQEKVVRQLLQAGADVKCCSTLYKTALAAAVDSTNPKIQIVLDSLEKNALFDNETGTGGWLLRWAALEGHESVVKLLLEKMTGLEPMTSYIPKTSVTLYKPSAFVGSPLGTGSPPYEAAYEGHDKVVKLLLPRWNNVDEEDRHGRTALHWASMHRHGDIVRMLLEKGADVHKPGPFGCTAKFWAFWHGDPLVQQLLEEACDSRRCDSCSQSLELALLERSRYEQLYVDLGLMALETSN